MIYNGIDYDKEIALLRAEIAGLKTLIAQLKNVDIRIQERVDRLEDQTCSCTIADVARLKNDIQHLGERVGTMQQVFSKLQDALRYIDF